MRPQTPHRATTHLLSSGSAGAAARLRALLRVADDVLDGPHGHLEGLGDVDDVAGERVHALVLVHFGVAVLLYGFLVALVVVFVVVERHLGEGGTAAGGEAEVVGLVLVHLGERGVRGGAKVGGWEIRTSSMLFTGPR